MRRQEHARMLVGLVLSGLALGLTASAATPDSSMAPDPRDKMSIWEGRWNEVVQTKETPYGHAASTPAHVTCSWTADRGYMVCEYLSEKADAGEKERSDHLTIFTYNSANKTYKPDQRRASQGVKQGVVTHPGSPSNRYRAWSDHLTIFTYNSANKTYKHLGISKDYKTLEEPNVVIEGNLWHYQYQISDDKGNQLELRDSYEFVSPKKRITRIEISADGGKHWTLMSESVGIKVH